MLYVPGMQRAVRLSPSSSSSSFPHALFSIQLHTWRWRWPYTKMTLPTGFTGEKALSILFLLTTDPLLYSYGFSLSSFIVGCFLTKHFSIWHSAFVGGESATHTEGFQEGSPRFRTMAEWPRTPYLEGQSWYFIIPFEGNCTADVCAECNGPPVRFPTHWCGGMLVLVFFSPFFYGKCLVLHLAYRVVVFLPVCTCTEF